MEILICVVVAGLISFIFGRYSVKGSFFGKTTKKSVGTKKGGNLKEKPIQDIKK